MSTAVIIVTYNGAGWIRPCLESCLVCECVTETIVVDNSSGDETCSIVENEFPQVTLIRLGENMGFGHANNIGISLALQKNPDGVMLLNQDAKLATDCVRLLEEAGQKLPEFGLFSPMHLNYHGTAIHRGFLKYLVMACQSLIDDCVLSKCKDHYSFANAPAALWWIPQRALRLVGGFDPLFFVYCEDSDYVNRVLGVGLQCALVPGATGRHDDSPGMPSVGKECELLLSQQLILLKNSTALRFDTLRAIRRILLRSGRALASFQFHRSWRIFSILFRLFENRTSLFRSREMLASRLDYSFLSIAPSTSVHE